MKVPIIEFRQSNLFVLDAFQGVFSEDGGMRMRRNVYRNLTTCVVDSDGHLWSFRFRGTNHAGARRLVGFFWNVSSDDYAYTTERDITVGRFREIVEPHLQDLDPDDRELALALLQPLAGCDPADLLKGHIRSLNL